MRLNGSQPVPVPPQGVLPRRCSQNTTPVRDDVAWATWGTVLVSLCISHTPRQPATQGRAARRLPTAPGGENFSQFFFQPKLKLCYFGRFFFSHSTPLWSPTSRLFFSIDGEVCGSKRPKEKWPKNDFSLWEQSRVWVVFLFLSLGAGVVPTVAGAVSHQEQTLTRTVTRNKRLCRQSLGTGGHSSATEDAGDL